MSRIIDLDDEGGTHDILTQTSLGGLLGSGKLLGGNPLKSYLDGNETPRYVLRNKKSGLTIEDAKTRTLKPNDEYQAVALVTDVRVLFVLGDAFEDETREIRLGEIVEAKAESGRLRKSTLIIATLSEETWKFPCRSDTSTVAKHIDDMSQIWANAGRLLDEVESQLSVGGEALEDDDYTRARDELDGVDWKIRTARERIQEVGQGAIDEIEGRATGLRERSMELKREIFAVEGATAHTQAQTEWRNAKYESAAQSYDEAIDAYEQALEKEGSRPDRETLVRRVKGAVSERELLKVGPMVDADTARRRASTYEDPEKAAHEWKRALDSYREMLSLEWGREQDEFVVDKATIRDQTTAVADDAIEDHHEAGRQWLASGDKLAVQGRREQAREVYERARDQFEQALQLAREVQPDHEDYLESALETVEERLSGTIPDEIPEEEPLSTAAISGLEDQEPETGPQPAQSESGESERSEEQDDTQTAVNPDVTDEQSPEKHPTGETKPRERTQAAETEPEKHAGAADGVNEQNAQEDDESTILGKIQSEKRDSNTATGKGHQTDDMSDDTAGRTDPEPPSTDPESPEQSGSHSERHERTRPEQSEPLNTSGAERREQPEASTDTQLIDMLRALDESAFTELVADLWEAQGWSTTVFSATANAVYDIVAMREAPAEERLLVWTVHREADGDIGTTVVKRCATARESSQGADSATLVTTGSLTSTARRRAEELDVAVVDAQELVNLLRFEELVDQLHAAVNS